MRVSKVSLLGLLCLIVTTTASAQGIPWVYNFEEAQQMAQRDQRLVLLHFYADWCGPCRVLEQAVFPNPLVGQTVAASFVPVKINVDENQELAKRYGVSQIPTDVIVDPQGRVLRQASSPSNPIQYVQLLSGVAASSAAAAPMHAVSTQVPQQGSLPTQTAWNSPWLGQNSGAAGSQGAQPPAGPGASGPTGWQDRAGAAAAESLLAEQAARQNTNWGQANWQPNATSNATHGAGGPAGAATASPQSLIPGQAGAGGYASNPYATASAASGPNGATSQPAMESRQEAWGQTPAYTNNSGSDASQSPPSGFGQQASTSPNPAAGNYSNPYAGPASNTPPAGATSPRPSSGLPVALDGFCPVTLAEEEKWEKGDVAWGALHRGRTYLFKNQEQQQRFLADPDRYSPVLSGYDPTQYVDSGQAVPGLRQHGMWFRGRIYLFTSEGSLDQFSRNPEHYAQRAHEIMMTAGR